MNCSSWSSTSWEPLILIIFSALMLKEVGFSGWPVIIFFQSLSSRSRVSSAALCIDNEVHQPAATAARCPHPQAPAACSHLDGFPPGLLPRAAGVNGTSGSASSADEIIVPITHIVLTAPVLSGVERRHPPCHWDPWDAVSSDKEAQLSPRGRWMNLCGATWISSPHTDSFMCVFAGLHHWFQGTLGSTPPEAWVCWEHLFPLQGNLSSCQGVLFWSTGMFSYNSWNKLVI